MVRSVPEAEWDEQQRAWMVALAQHEDSLCPNCGRPLSICTAESAEGNVEVPPPTRCHFTTRVMQARKAYEKSQYPQALMFLPRLRD